MRTLLIIAAILVTLVLLVVVAGLLLPRAHRVTSRLALPVPPDSVWAVVRDVGQLPSWWPDVKAVERLEQTGGK